jgi:hypothetical protein
MNITYDVFIRNTTTLRAHALKPNANSGDRYNITLGSHVFCYVQQSAPKDANSLVIYNNTVTTVGELVLKQRELQPDCSVNYHTLKEVVVGDGGPAFTFEQANFVVFVPANQQALSEAEGGGGQQEEITQDDDPISAQGAQEGLAKTTWNNTFLEAFPFLGVPHCMGVHVFVSASALFRFGPELVRYFLGV